MQLMDQFCVGVVVGRFVFSISFNFADALIGTPVTIFVPR